MEELDERVMRHIRPILEAIASLTTQVEQLREQLTQSQRLEDAAMSLIFYRNKNAKARSKLGGRRQTVTAQGTKARPA